MRGTKHTRHSMWLKTHENAALKNSASSHARRIHQSFATMTSSQARHGWNIPPSEWCARAGHCPLALTLRTTTIQPPTPTTSSYPAQRATSCASQANSLASSSPLCRFWHTPQKLQGRSGSFLKLGHLAKTIRILETNLNPNLVCRFSMTLHTVCLCFCWWKSLSWSPKIHVSTTDGLFLELDTMDWSTVKVLVWRWCAWRTSRAIASMKNVPGAKAFFHVFAKKIQGKRWLVSCLNHEQIPGMISFF